MQPLHRQNQILEILGKHRQPTTAAHLAERLDTSVRTIYRDMANMVARNIPITGEAGIGYVLEAGYHLPPLMFHIEELEALSLGARLVQRSGDPQLGQAAKSAFEKIKAVLPTRLKDSVETPTLRVVPIRAHMLLGRDLAEVRKALRQERKVKIHYRDEKGNETERVLWPVILGYFEQTSVLVAWCETRDGFRHFRTDRIGSAELLPDDLPTKRKELEKRWRDDNHQLPRTPSPERST